MQRIEDTIRENSLPVNNIAMLNRMIELLKENNTNSFECLRTEEAKLRFRAALWLINSKVFGQLAKIDMMDEWEELTDVPFNPDEKPE